MREKEGVIRIAIIWRGRKLIVEMNAGATLKDFGTELQKLTDVKAETLRLIVPEFASKSSKLLRPFSDEHSNFRLPENLATENKPIRMMGVPEAEVDEVLESAKTDLRIAGFDEEERRLRLRMLDRPRGPIKLPQGAYIFCDFRTLQLPGVELYPPASEALRRMHMLAADPGIVAIMNKHRWRVGVMSEMAPIGYVGISPKCILGLNKNHGEEISLRLRTDDLKGFRKFESIKKTLLHELAHMVYSEHDANFYALDKQLNQEAGSLDWTRSQSETLSGIKHSNNHHDYYEIDEVNNLPQKVGGNMSDQLASARASSVAAAFRRISTSATSTEVTQAVHDEPDPDDSDFSVLKHSSTLVSSEMKKIDSKNLNNQHLFNLDLVPGVSSVNKRNCEPNPDDSHGNDTLRIYTPTKAPRAINDGDTVMTDVCCPLLIEPDPDDSDHFADSVITSSDPNDILKDKNLKEREKEPDPDDSEVISIETVDEQACREGSRSYAVPDFGKFQVNEVSHVEPDPDESIRDPLGAAVMQTDEPDPDDQELKRIQDPVSAVCNRMQKAIKMLQSQLNHMEASKVLETLVKIIRNVIEHPDEVKFRRLRKANPFIQRTIASSTAALEILSLIGFSEDVVFDNTGKAEAYLVLKRNDPGLLWLAKSSIETCIAC